MRERPFIPYLDPVGLIRRSLIAGALVALAVTPADAQWTNRYPKNNGFNHHVYLEGYEMPIMAAGVLDPAIAPDGRSIAFASRYLEAGNSKRAKR